MTEMIQSELIKICRAKGRGFCSLRTFGVEIEVEALNQTNDLLCFIIDNNTGRGPSGFDHADLRRLIKDSVVAIASDKLSSQQTKDLLKIAYENPRLIVIFTAKCAHRSWSIFVEKMTGYAPVLTVEKSQQPKQRAWL
jgi:hypothetical protein